MDWRNSTEARAVFRVGDDLEAQERCAQAKLCEEAEDFAATRESLGYLYDADDVVLSALSAPTRAEVYLRTGSLMRRLAGREKAAGAQERVKSRLLKALELFRSLGDDAKAAETLIAMAASYTVTGSYSQSRLLLNDPVFCLCNDPDIQAGRLYILAIAARSEGSDASLHEALELHQELLPYCDILKKPALTCRYKGEYANVLLMLGESEGRPDYINDALYHYTVASQEAEEAGNIRFAGFVINNVGYIFFKYGRHEEAHERLDKARAIFERLHNWSCIAQVDETRAQVLNAQGRFEESEKLIRRSIQALEISGESALQAEALLTRCSSLVGLGRNSEAENCASHAAEIYALNESKAGEGKAQLALAELLMRHQPPPLGRLLRSSLRAVRLLASEKDAALVKRLEAVERRVLELAGEDMTRRFPVAVEPTAPPPYAAWGEDTLDEAKARVEEWYLARLVLEGGTLESIADELDLTPEGVRQKLIRYPHLRLLRKAMRDSRVRPINTRRRARPLKKIRLKDGDEHLSNLGPHGGDLIGIEPCESLLPSEMGAIRYKGTAYLGYYDTTGDGPTLQSKVEGYPPFPLHGESVHVIGRVVGYWRKGEEGQRMRRIKKN